MCFVITCGYGRAQAGLVELSTQRAGGFVRRLDWLRFVWVSAFRNLGRAPRRTVVSLAAMGAATAALILFESFVQGVRATFRHNVVTSSLGHYQIYRKGYRQNKGHEPFGYQVTESEELKKQIANEVGPLVFFSKRLDFFGLVGQGDRSVAAKGRGIDAKAERTFLTLFKVVDGKHLADSEGESVFLGQGLAKQLGLKVGDNATILVNTAGGSLNALDLTVVGLFTTGVTELDDQFFYVDNQLAQKLLRVEGASSLLMGFQGEDELVYQEKLKRVVEGKYPHLEVLHWHDLIADYFDNTMGWLEAQFNVFRAIIIIIATLSIINVFTMSLMERTGEFGTLRAIGTYRGEIGLMVLTESVVQALIGTLAGIFLAIIAIKLVLVNGVTMPPPPQMTSVFHVSFAIPWSGIPFNFFLCVLVAGGAGLLPALKISRLNIVQALGRNV